jgi:CheY-like chemotaxis protein
LTKNKKILIVEDEPLIRQVVARYVGVLGYRASVCSTGRDALAHTRKHQTDALILDQQLPDMMGMEIYRQLLQDAGAIPTILTSAYKLSASDLRVARELGIRGFIQKPFNFRVLKSMLSSLFRTRKFLSSRSRFSIKTSTVDLRPSVVAKQVFKKVFRSGLDRGGHVHFHVQGHPDHLILLCGQHSPGKVIAKSPQCKKGECIKWEQSTFTGFDQETVLEDLSAEINQVRVDAADYEMSWPTLADFLCWLEFNHL